MIFLTLFSNIEILSTPCISVESMVHSSILLTCPTWHHSKTAAQENLGPDFRIRDQNFISHMMLCWCWKLIWQFIHISHRKVAASRSSVSREMASVFLSDNISLFTNFAQVEGMITSSHSK